MENSFQQQKALRNHLSSDWAGAVAVVVAAVDLWLSHRLVVYADNLLLDLVLPNRS